MNGSHLLDTNVAIRILNQQIDLDARVDETGGVLLCLTVVGELLYGAAKSGRPDANRARVDRLLEVCPLVPHDLETAERYGSLKEHLHRTGRPIPENDLWIAASALRRPYHPLFGERPSVLFPLPVLLPRLEPRCALATVVPRVWGSSSRAVSV